MKEEGIGDIRAVENLLELSESERNCISLIGYSIR